MNMEKQAMNIGVIVASTRPGRNGAQIADWVKQTTDKDDGVDYTYLDLADINLPFLNEPNLPAMKDYQAESTKKWAELVAQQDAFLIITPEYNHSFPASLKNALDTLYSEWSMKPAGYVGYGSLGAVRAIEHLNSVLLKLSMVPIADKTTNILLFNHMDKNGKFVPTDHHGASLVNTLEHLKSWAKILKKGQEA